MSLGVLPPERRVNGRGSLDRVCRVDDIANHCSHRRSRRENRAQIRLRDTANGNDGQVSGQCDRLFQEPGTTSRERILLRRGREDGAKADVVDRQHLRGLNLLEIVRRQPDDQVRPAHAVRDGADVSHREVVLTDVNAVRFRHQRDVETIVHDEQRSGISGQPPKLTGGVEQRAAIGFLVTKLNDTHAALQQDLGPPNRLCDPLHRDVRGHRPSDSVKAVKACTLIGVQHAAHRNPV